MTEMPPGTESLKHLFLLRNRIIASLSLATIVVEAAESSGSLITAKIAIEENRDVFAVPGPITSEQSAGVNGLLKMGAIPCTGADDILRAFDLHAVSPDLRDVDISEAECGVLDVVAQPLHVDDIVRDLKHPAAEVTALLMTLVLKGLVEQQEGNVYGRTKAGIRASKLRDRTSSN